MSNDAQEVILPKLAPPLGVVGATIAGLSLQDWVYALTILYTVLMISHHVWTKIIRPNLPQKRRYRRWDDPDPDKPDGV